MIDETLTQAIAAALSDHPDPASVPALAQNLCAPLEDDTTARPIRRLLENGLSVAAILMVCADYYRTECDGEREASVLEAFTRRWSILEAAGH